MTEDPFPRERVAAMLRRLPAYLHLTWRLAREPLLGKARRMAVVAAAGYVVSPIDLVPGVIPVVGQLDDIAVALAAIRFALDGLTPERRRVHLEAVGLGDADLLDDLRTVGATSAWLVRAGARTTVRVTRAGGRAAVMGAGIAAGVTRRLATGGADAAQQAGAKAMPVLRRARDAAGPKITIVARRLHRPGRTIEPGAWRVTRS